MESQNQPTIQEFVDTIIAFMLAGRCFDCGREMEDRHVLRKGGKPKVGRLVVP
jgi:hypothetical protein